MFYFIFIQSLLWCLNPYFRKEALKTYTSMEFQLQLGMGNLILNCMSLYYGERNGFGLNKWMILCIVNTFAASYFLNYMSKHLNISEFIPIVQPMVIVLTTFIDFSVFKIYISLQKMIAILFILMGIILFKFDFSTKVNNTNVSIV